MHKIKGVSLIELLIVISILSILTSFAAYFSTKSQTQNKAEIACQTLFHNLHYARSQAIKLHSTIGVCPTENRVDCVNQWGGQFIIFNKNSSPKEILRHVRINTNIVNIKCNLGFGKNIFYFYPSGRSSYNFSCNILNLDDNIITKKIVVAQSGRIRTENLSS